jgi:hypothetical protein
VLGILAWVIAMGSTAWMVGAIAPGAVEGAIPGLFLVSFASIGLGSGVLFAFIGFGLCVIGLRTKLENRPIAKLRRALWINGVFLVAYAISRAFFYLQ